MILSDDVLVEILTNGKYLTACYARLNRMNNTISIVNAGHLPLVYLPKNDKARFIEMPGDIIGAFKDVCYEQQDFNVYKGDRFFIYSDGLIERYGRRMIWTESMPELLKKCNQLRDIPIDNASDKLFNLLQEQNYKQEDDVVVLSIEV